MLKNAWSDRSVADSVFLLSRGEMEKPHYFFCHIEKIELYGQVEVLEAGFKYDSKTKFTSLSVTRVQGTTSACHVCV